jgi:anti-sigma B factor antagonist
MQAQPPRPQDLLSLHYVINGGWVTVPVMGQLDAYTGPVLRAAIAPNVLPGGRIHVALNLAGLTFCDSAGLQCVTQTAEILQAHGGQLVFLRAPDWMMGRLRLAGIEPLISTGDRLDEHRRPAKGPPTVDKNRRT